MAYSVPKIFPDGMCTPKTSWLKDNVGSGPMVQGKITSFQLHLIYKGAGPEMMVGPGGTIAGEVYCDVEDGTGPCCADHWANEIFRPALAYKVLTSPLLQGIGDDRTTFLSIYSSVA